MIALASAFLALLTAQSPEAPSNGTSPFDQAAPEPARIVGIQVRGNHTTPDEEVVRLAGIATGQPFTDAILTQAQARLDESHRFRTVEVQRRYQSLTNLSAILLVIVVEERVAVTLRDPHPGPLRALRAHTMWLPVLRFEDGYGVSYGARFSLVDVVGPRSRISVPLTWGGERRATAEFERTFARGPLSRILATGGVWRRENPAFDEGDRRAGATLLAERALTSWMRIGADASTASVSFGSETDRLTTAGVRATVDTRHDPAFPRNAIYATVSWDQLWFDRARDTNRVSADVRGFVGLFGQTVLAVRAQQVRAEQSLPVFEQALLGGTESLRGFKLGFRNGDRLAAGSLELRMPVSSPRNIGRAGIALFADTGAAYDAETTLDRARFDTGVGAGWFLQLPALSFRLDVAHGLGAGTRAHVTLGVTF